RPALDRTRAGSARRPPPLRRRRACARAGDGLGAEDVARRRAGENARLGARLEGGACALLGFLPHLAPFALDVDEPEALTRLAWIHDAGPWQGDLEADRAEQLVLRRMREHVQVELVAPLAQLVPRHRHR